MTVAYAEFTSLEIIDPDEVADLFNDLDARLTALEGIAFVAHGSSTAMNDHMLAASSATKLIMDTEDLDTAAAYNTTDARWTPAVAGWYMIGCALILLDSVNASDTLYAHLYKNGAIDSTMGFVTAPVAGTLAVSAQVPVHLDADDYVEVWGQQTSSSARRWSNTGTKIFGYLINAD